MPSCILLALCAVNCCLMDKDFMGEGTPSMLGDMDVPPFWPPFLTFWGLNSIFWGYFFSSTNTKMIFWGIKTTNSYRFRSFRPQISFFPRSFWVQVSAASGTPPSVFGPSTPPGGYPLLAKMQLNWCVVNKAWQLLTDTLIKHQSICIWYNDCLGPMDQYWRIVNWPIWIELQLIWTKECNFHTIKNEFENVVCKMAVRLSWSQWVRFELTQYWALSIELQECNNASDLWTQVARFRVFFKQDAIFIISKFRNV